MFKLCVIGSSNIVDHHLMAAKKLGFSLYAIASTRKNSINAKKKFYKFKIEKYFSDYRELIRQTNGLKNICYLVAPRIKDTLKILYELEFVNSPILVEKPISTSIKGFSTKIKKKIFLLDIIEYFMKQLDTLNLLN